MSLIDNASRRLVDMKVVVGQLLFGSAFALCNGVLCTHIALLSFCTEIIGTHRVAGEDSTYDHGRYFGT